MVANISVLPSNFTPYMPTAARFETWKTDENEPASIEKFTLDAEEVFCAWSQDILYHREKSEHDLEYSKLKAQSNELHTVAEAHIKKIRREVTDITDKSGLVAGVAERRRLFVLHLAIESERNRFEQEFLKAEFLRNLEEIQRTSGITGLE